ncbi:hypothetical protein C6A77_15340 [Pseudomonas sp. AFG_SD02_1510_Pfu_092]|uniref:hypothetical protein n=1 Tax=Pseudomonas sp. AFG_SD02_1510_Pfu_092 TaxID=2259497 RepID=UPI000DEF8E0D|nr:hypothetical protein [Pseudomonas sp. AFG_SD02_1510_Pfu_092]RCL24853.1 hypothetical protein C6A77_15340 [Pseudomonas sp. AFG_SD02_1510_Pfu_092]
MFHRILLIALLGLMTSACVPYYEDGGYYRSDRYYSDRYVSPGYYRYDRYYVTPQPRYYYQPAPRHYYRSAPAPHYRSYPQPGMKQWRGNPRDDYGNRQRYDYGRDRDRHDYRGGGQRYQNERWHSNGRGDGDRRWDGRRGSGQGGNWRR